MGAGKTSKGRKLSKRLGIGFADMDVIIEEQEGMSIQEIFSLKGEQWFRSKETEVLHQLGRLNEDMVISTGGGAPCHNNNMEFINSTGLSVYLKMSPEELAGRLTRSNKPVRPLLKDKTPEQLLEFIREKLAERERFYLLSRFIIPAANLKTKELKRYLDL